MTQIIDTASFASVMRERIIRLSSQEILIARLSGSDQEADITLPTNCDGFGRIRNFLRLTSPGWPDNPLPIDPASRKLGLACGDKMQAQVFQNGACAWRCWYCYVPFNLLSGDASRGRWMTTEALTSLYTNEKNPPAIIDLSGGSPDLTPEWIPWMMQSLEDAGISRNTYLWSDDNLSTDYLFTKLTEKDRQTLVGYRNYGRVCCVKGFDEESFSFNTTAAPQGFEKQFQILREYLSLGIDVYGYITLTGNDLSSVEKEVPKLIDRLQRLGEHLPLRVVPLEISNFTPTDKRARDSGGGFALANQVQQKAIKIWMHELDLRYTKADRDRNIADVPIS